MEELAGILHYLVDCSEQKGFSVTDTATGIIAFAVGILVREYGTEGARRILASLRDEYLASLRDECREGSDRAVRGGRA